MADRSTQLPVLIIGGGMGGLALANALTTHNVRCQVYERDESAAGRAQGYRIRIKDTHLRRLLPDDLWTQFESSCGDVGAGFCSVGATTGERLAKPAQRPDAGNAPPALHAGKPWNADRRVLRDLMMGRLLAEGIVHFGKRFVRYEPGHDGVVACFEDGTRVKGRLLVGADGARSAVRKQLIPGFALLDTEGRSIFGKTPITDPDEEFWGAVVKEAGQGICLIDDGPTLKLFCDVMRFSRRTESPVTLPPDYVYWVVVTRADRIGLSDRDFLDLDPDQAVELSLEFAKHWDPRCREILVRQNRSETSTLAFATTYPDLKAWDAKADEIVTLIGDAAHPMTPVGGVGANAAFEDAAMLLQAILKGEEEMSTNIAEYEQGMRKAASVYLSRSQGGSGHMFGMRPVEELKAWTL